MASRHLLKRDALGTISVDDSGGRRVLVRDTAVARPGLRRLAAQLAGREAKALERLQAIDGLPRLRSFDGRQLVRSYLPGDPLHRAVRPDAAYFRQARRLLQRIHRAGVTHNDLAKEANWLRLPDGACAIVDFQLATCFRTRHRWFRMLAREDIRHLLKHKRHYVPSALSARERALLARPSRPARAWRLLVKPLYLFITRQLLGWPERPDAEERGAQPKVD